MASENSKALWEPVIKSNPIMVQVLGICSGIPTDDLTVEAMLKAADLALYQSKENGRNRVTLFAADVAALERLHRLK